MSWRVHEHLLDDRGRGVVRVGVPADVLAGELEAEADLAEFGKDAAIARDRVAEVVTIDHVLAAPPGDGAQRCVDPECREPGVRAASICQGDKFGRGVSAERSPIPGERARRDDERGHRCRSEEERDGECHAARCGAEVHDPQDRAANARWVWEGHAIQDSEDQPVWSTGRCEHLRCGAAQIPLHDGPGRGRSLVPVAAVRGGVRPISPTRYTPVARLAHVARVRPARASAVALAQW